MAMSEPSQPNDSEQMELPMTSFAADSPAKTQVSPMLTAKAQTESAPASLARPFALLAEMDRSSLWKTSQSCLIEGLETFSARWPTSGIMRNGKSYQPVVSAYLISEKDYGFLPTPMARDWKDLSRNGVFLSQLRRSGPSLVAILMNNGVSWWKIAFYYEAAMGYPYQWTKVGLRERATQSSRKSLNSSAKQSPDQ